MGRWRERELFGFISFTDRWVGRRDGKGGEMEREREGELFGLLSFTDR